jgi:hypothetical protein
MICGMAQVLRTARTGSLYSFPTGLSTREQLLFLEIDKQTKVG